MKYKIEADNDDHELQTFCWQQNNGHILSVADEYYGDFPHWQQFLSVWQYPNGITKPPMKTKILIDESSRGTTDFKAMVCNRDTNTVVLGGMTEPIMDDNWTVDLEHFSGFVVTVPLETGRVKERKKCPGRVKHLESMNHFGAVIGITDEMVFTSDFRAKDVLPNVLLETTFFSSLSLNHSSGYHFVVTDDEAMIFDLRNVKEPITSYDCDREDDEDLDRVYVDHVNWSPNGKYIYTTVRNPYDINKRQFFWDVDQSTKIYVNVENLNDGLVTDSNWIGDHIVIKATHGSLFSTSPMSPTKLERIDFIPEMEESIENEGYTYEESPETFGIKKIEYNTETMQLAGLTREKIFIWSHDKCQPQATLNN